MNLSLAWVLPLVLVAGVKAMGERQPRNFEAGCYSPHRTPRRPAAGGLLQTVSTQIGVTMMIELSGQIGYRSMSGSPQVSMDLDLLLGRVACRDVDAFATFYDRTRSRVFGLVVRVLRNPGYSEEVTQDVYLQVWRGAEGFDSRSGSALAWLLTLAHRRAVDRVRSEQAASKREARYGAATVESAGDVVADAALHSDERRRVVECLGGLTDLQRQSIELAYYDGLTYVQVSERLSANLATIKSRIRDGLRSLRNCLDVS